ncbi:hypothetical protein [Methanocella conradii]|uniref:hypothetical protein n=1 Tax=Methanocella conradii TaxID=1175444 RepID=UPI00157BC4F9|nr:hypothetical protein [Methanocella conradii]
MSSAPTITTVVTDVFNSILTIVDQVAQTIAANAGVFAQVLIVGGIAYVVYRFGTGLVRRLAGLFRGYGF